MKKRIFAWALIAICLFVGPTASAAKFTASKAGIKLGGKSYKVGQITTSWKKKLGTYKRKLNETNGSLRSYTYTAKGKGLKIDTVYSTKLKKEKIVSITVSGKSVATASGMKVGQTGKKAQSLYGKKYLKNGNVYTYKSGKRKLQVKASNGRITAFKIS